MENGSIQTHQNNIFRLPSNKVLIRLNMAPDDPRYQDDTFTLHSTDSSSMYEKTLVVKDDQQPGDDYLDLLFEGLDCNCSYTLNVKSGNEEYDLFQDVPFDQLTSLSPSESEETDESQDDEEEETEEQSGSNGTDDREEDLFFVEDDSSDEDGRESEEEPEIDEDGCGEGDLFPQGIPNPFDEE